MILAVYRKHDQKLEAGAAWERGYSLLGSWGHGYHATVGKRFACKRERIYKSAYYMWQ